MRFKKSANLIVLFSSTFDILLGRSVLRPVHAEVTTHLICGEVNGSTPGRDGSALAPGDCATNALSLQELLLLLVLECPWAEHFKAHLSPRSRTLDLALCSSSDRAVRASQWERWDADRGRDVGDGRDRGASGALQDWITGAS